MFVLLEHHAPAGLHWDFMLELPHQAELATWRLAENPLARTDPTVPVGPLLAEAIFAHPRRFLDYEGVLRGGKGTVRRLERGPARVTRFDRSEVLAVLGGARLRGNLRMFAADRCDSGRRPAAGEPTPRDQAPAPKDQAAAVFVGGRWWWTLDPTRPRFYNTR